MTISFVGSAIAHDAVQDSDDLIITPPAHQADDFAVIIWRNRYDTVAEALGVPTGWTKYRTDRTLNSWDAPSGIFYKVLSGSDGAATMTWGGGTASQNGAIMYVFRGVDTASPFDAFAMENSGDGTQGTNDSTPNPPDITTVADNCALILAHMNPIFNGYQTYGAPGNPSGLATPIGVDGPPSGPGGSSNSGAYANIIATYKEDVGAAGLIDFTEGTDDWTHGLDQTLISGQDETNYDGAGSNGVFNGGTGYTVSDTLTMDNGAVITVDAVSGGVVTQFTRTASSDWTNTHIVASAQLGATGGTGNDDFTITPESNNIGDAYTSSKHRGYAIALKPAAGTTIEVPTGPWR